MPTETSTNWQSAPFYVIETELSPATLIHSSGRYLGLFRGLAASGLGAPTAVAWSTRSGPRSFKNAEPIDVTQMEENWGLVWFAGASNWIHWDSAWAFFLQHRPASMKLDPDGLHLTFSNRVGDVVLLPLYGAYKPPLPAHDLLVEHGLPSHKIKTWEWTAALPRDPLVRLRFWARVSRRFPLHCGDSFSVDRGNDSVTIRSRLEWRAIEDDWNTAPLFLSPLSPVLALAIRNPGLPVRFSAPPFDLGMFTTSGPYYGIPDAETFTATFSVLQYINETEVAGSSTNKEASVTAAGEQLKAAAQEVLKKAQAIPFDYQFARALPYYDTETASNAVAALKRAFAEQFPSTNDVKSGLTADEAGDALEALWAYANFSGDGEFIRQRWPAIARLFQLGMHTRWAAFGRLGSGELTRGASVCAAFARLAYLAGDMDAYGYACALFARELVQDWVRIQGADYFRRHQPIHSAEFMQGAVYLNQLGRDGDGWQMDEPRYPAAAEQRHFKGRWTHFADPDLGRFFQDYLGPETFSEMEALREEQGGSAADSRARLRFLRALLLNEPLSRLTAVTPGSGETVSPTQAIANAIAILRASRPLRFERLIPSGESTPFVTGPERDVSLPETAWLGAQLEPDGTANKAARWPQLGWGRWKTPSGISWSVGHIQPVRSGMPRSVKVIPLNWNTRVLTFELP